MAWTTDTTSFSVSGLSANTTYYFAVLVKDASGNESLYTPVSVTTGSTADTTAPTTGTAVSCSGTSATGTTVSWGAATDNVSAAASLSYKVVQASSSGAIDTVAEADAATVTMAWTTDTTSFGVTSLTASTTYYFAVLVKDAAGNMSLYAPVSVTTSDTPDTTAPTAGTAVSFTGTTATGTTVSWGAASDIVTTAANLSYKVVQASSSAAIDTVAEADAATVTMAWAVNTLTTTVTGLSSSTTYYFAVLVKDAAGNEALYAPASVATSAAADTTAPVTGTAVSFSSTTATGTTVSWGAASDNVTAAASLSYKVVQASSSAAIDTVAEADAATVTMAWTANTTSYGVTGLTATTTYYFAVLVKDAVGNEALYAPVSVTTSAAADTTPPTLSSVSSSGAAATAVTLAATSSEAGTMYYVVTTSSTAPTATQVVAGQNDSGASAVKSGNSSVSAATAKSFSVSGLTNFTKYYYYIAAVDGSSNRSTVSSGNFATIGDGCVLRYTFDNVTTDSVGSYNLTVHAGSAAYSSSQKKEGSAALSLNGSTSLTTSFTTSDTESISAWVYLSSTSGSPLAVTLGGSSGRQFYYSSGDLLGWMENGGVAASGTFTSNAWHHVVLTTVKSTDALYLYIDGVQYTSSGSGNNDEDATLYIGDDSSGSYFWTGYIDDVQIYNRVLSASEVSAQYNSY
jgi:hypothetical protein